MNKIFLTFLVIFAISCTHSVHIVHVGDFKPFQKFSSGTKIEAEEEQFLFLGFTLETNYINVARQKLLSQCEKGVIQGPVTRVSTSHGLFSWTNKVHMQALCLEI